jgi:hypothetical protein
VFYSTKKGPQSKLLRLGRGAPFCAGTAQPIASRGSAFNAMGRPDQETPRIKVLHHRCSETPPRNAVGSSWRR